MQIIAGTGHSTASAVGLPSLSDLVGTLCPVRTLTLSLQSRRCASLRSTSEPATLPLCRYSLQEYGAETLSVFPAQFAHCAWTLRSLTLWLKTSTRLKIQSKSGLRAKADKRIASHAFACSHPHCPCHWIPIRSPVFEGGASGVWTTGVTEELTPPPVEVGFTAQGPCVFLLTGACRSADLRHSA